MLNRHHSTLSALSSRLNLGTRSLVLATGVNDGVALRIREDYCVSMRVLMAMPPAPSISSEARPASPITRSESTASACCQASSKASKPGKADPFRVSPHPWRSWRFHQAARWTNDATRQTAARIAA